MTRKIDVVFTYVDGKDTKWLKKKTQYFNNDKQKTGNSKLKFESINEIYYSVKTVLYFAPWINYI